MKKYIISRIFQLLFVLLGISMLSFALMQLAAGDYVDTTYARMGTSVSAQAKQEARANLGLDQTALAQYLSWIGALLHGDMGNSFVSGRAVSQVLSEKLAATLLLSVCAIGISILISVPVGILSAVKQNTLPDRIAHFFCFFANATPSFLVGIGLLYVFSIKLRIVPIIAPSGVAGAIMPALALSIPLSAQYIRQIRSAVLEEYRKDFVFAARARGVRERDILLRSIIKSVAPTLLTLLSMSVGALLSGSVIVESIFMWDGVGKLAVDSIAARDYPVIQAYVLWMAVIYALVHLVCDIVLKCIMPSTHLAETEVSFS